MERRPIAVLLRVPAVLAVAALAGALLSGCTPSRHGTYDGSCAATRSAVSGVDAATGRRLWHRELAHPRDDRPELGGGAALLRGCGVLVLDANDGTRVLRQREESGVLGLADGHLVTSVRGDVTAVPLLGGPGFRGSSTPAWSDVTLAGDLVLVVDSGVAALDPSAGRETWRADLASTGQVEAVEAHGVLAVVAGDGSVYRLDPRTGEVVWRVVPPAGTALGYGRLRAVGRTALAVEVGDDGVAGIDLATGAQLWRRTDLRGDERAAWAAAGDVAVVPTGAAVVAVALRSGRDRWRLGAASSGPVAVGSTLVVDDATSYAGVDPGSGRVLWRRATQHHPLLGADPAGDLVVVLDSPAVPHGMNDCC